MEKYMEQIEAMIKLAESTNAGEVSIEVEEYKGWDVRLSIRKK